MALAGRFFPRTVQKSGRLSVEGTFPNGLSPRPVFFLADFSQSFYNSTVLHPLAGVMTVVLGGMVMGLPRRFAFLPFLVLVCFISSAQRIAVGGLDFNLLRILVIFAMARLIFRGELKQMKWCGMDSAMIGWAIWQAIGYNQLRGWEMSGIIYQCGQKFEALGLYFAIRGLLRDWEDLKRLSAVFAIICIPVAVFFLVEYSTGRNSFSIFGGVPAVTYIREGRMRCNGAFAHPILAGGFFASLGPIAAARHWGKGGKLTGMLGGISALLVVFTTSSSTSWGAGLAGIAAGCLFPWRLQMKQIRWAGVAILTTMHMSMTMPVWHLLARIDLVGGSTGWHRYNLINQCVERWREWGPIGVVSTGNWGIQLFDVTNQYVLEAISGGMLTLILFCTKIGLGFKYAGQAIRANKDNREQLVLSYALGVALWVHCVNFIGVSYFGQMTFCWYLVLAALASTGETVRHGVQKDAPELSLVEDDEPPPPTFGRRKSKALPRRRPTSGLAGV